MQPCTFIAAEAKGRGWADAFIPEVTLKLQRYLVGITESGINAVTFRTKKT
jgi:hypothetical protein